MNQGKDNWDKLINLPTEYTQNPGLVSQAIEKIQAKEKKIRENWFQKRWKYLVACSAACILALCIGIPIYHALIPPKVVYYDINEITYETVSDPALFVTENHLGIKYFNLPTVKTQCAVVDSTNDLVFLMQDILYMDETGFDKVNMKVILRKDARFEFYQRFDVLEYNTKVKDILVQYGASTINNANEKVFLVKFNYDKVDYFMEITTEGIELERLEFYVNMLIA